MLLAKRGRGVYRVRRKNDQSEQLQLLRGMWVVEMLMKMKILKMFLRLISIALITISLTSFILNDVADSIFYMVVAIFIEQGLGRIRE